MANKYYWLKLQRNFFKRHDIRIIEELPNGKDYILFYLKLLCESIDHEGNLRFSDQIPYNEEMLATITNTNIDIVRSAIKVFTQLNMMEIMDDGTYFMSEVQKMIGSETEWAKKQREYRANKRQQEDIVLSLSDKSKSKSKSIDKDIDININKDINKDINKKKKELSKDNSLKEKGKFIPPTVEEVEVYCNERGNGVDAEKFVDFYTSKGWMVGSNKMKDWKAAVRTWERKEKSKGGALNGKPNNTTKQYTEEQLDRFAELL